MSSTLILNATIVNEGKITSNRDVLIKDQLIEKIDKDLSYIKADKVIDAKNLYLIPGVIDDQVHFREPGLTHKGDIASESRAAVAGGVTTFMEMPNTNPQTVTVDALEDKMAIASKNSLANYSFFFGATNENLEEVKKVDPKATCGVKVFMGSSTGNMLVDKEAVLEEIFKNVDMIIATHCEDEATVRANLEIAKEKYGEDIPWHQHPVIRSEEACYLSSSKAVALAKKHNARLHVLHITTEKELTLFDNSIPLEEKRITAEACVHHLWFSDKDYTKSGSFIKWNPAIKKETDRLALVKAVKNGTIDIIASDHAPHTRSEKMNTYTTCPSGGPLVQHTLPAMLEFYHNDKLKIRDIVTKMCHNPAKLFNIEKRGFIKEGYYADIALLDMYHTWVVENENILSKCKWSPFEGQMFRSRVTHTFVSGKLAYADKKIQEVGPGMRITFNR